MKHLHKFYNKEDIPWVQLVGFKHYSRKVPHASAEVCSFWWKYILRLNVLYRGITKCNVGDGKTVTFWENLWTKEILASKFPILHSFVRNSNSSVHDLMNAEDLDSLFLLPLSLTAMDDMISLQQMLVNIPYNADSKDTWTLIWGNQVYTT
jgi:hypothetical protein